MDMLDDFVCERQIDEFFTEAFYYDCMSQYEDDCDTLEYEYDCAED